MESSGRFLLSERDTQPLVAPLGLSGRIKYTCVDLSTNFIALGANTGGVYCFHSDCRYIQLLANKEGGVSVVRISPDEQYLAVVAGGGWLVLWELRLSGDGVCKRLQVSGLLKEAVIRDVVWEGKKGRLFFGDSLGRVAVTSLPKSVKKSSLLRRANEVIFQDKSPVVQLDLHGDVLLVSTVSRAVLLLLSSATKTALQVGRKPRDGQFGACLDVRENQLLVYSARPGGRLWEAGLEGGVQSTIKLRELFTSPPTPVLGCGFEPQFTPELKSLSHPSSLSLSCLLSLHNGHTLVSWDDAGLYLWQPSSWKLTVWTRDLEGIVGVACRLGKGEEVNLCIIVDGGKKVVMVTMATLPQCIQFMVQEELKLMEQVTKLVGANMVEIVSLLPLHPSLHPSLLTSITHHSGRTSSHPLSLQLLTLKTLLLQQHTKEDVAEVENREDGTEEEVEEERKVEDEIVEEVGEEKGVKEEDIEQSVEQITIEENTRFDVPDAVGKAEVKGPKVSHGLSHDDSEVGGWRPRVHRRSNSWSGVQQELDALQLTGGEDGEEVWSLSGSHTPSYPFLSEETSQDPVSMETLSLESSSEQPPTGVSPPQPLSMPSSLDDHSLVPGGRGAEPSNKPRCLRSQSLQLTGPPRIAMASLPDHDSDDVIAVPVRFSMAGSENGVKVRSKKKTRRSKKSSTSSSSLPHAPTSLPPSLSPSTADVREQSLGHIPEEFVLPFPDAGLPHSRHQLDSAHLQKGSSFITKMRELAKQGGQNEALQEALQQPVKKVKELFSSLAATVPTALSLHEPQTVFLNDEFLVHQELPQPLMTGVNQSDRAGAKAVMQQQNLVDSEFAAATLETKEALALPDVYCSSDALKATMNKWLVAMETAVGSDENACLQGVGRAMVVDLLTLSLEVEAYGSEDGFIPFLGRYSRLLHGMRTMSVLGALVWGVRREGWRVLVRKGKETREGGADSKKITDVISHSALAPDLPTYVSSLVSTDPESLPAVCVENWPNVQPWHVALACSIDQSDGSEESRDKGDLFLDVYAGYLSRLLESGRCLQGDEECVLASLERILVAGPPLDQLATPKHRPRAWSHKVSWVHSILLDQLVHLCVAMTMPYLNKAASLCEKYGYWLGVVELAVAMGNKGKSLLIILYLRDASLLDGCQKWGNLLETVPDWQEALQLMSDITSRVTSHMIPDESHVTKELTMSVLVRQLVASVGPSLAVKIIGSVGVVGGGVSGEEGAELHSLLVQLADVHSQQKSVSRNLLEKVDRYLWSRRPAAVCAELELMEEREREGRKRGEMKEEVQVAVEWCPRLEESGRHWGVRVGGGGRCGVCHHSLSVKMSAQHPGLLVFHCGHAYHRHCLPELACYICFQQNVSKHFSHHSS